MTEGPSRSVPPIEHGDAGAADVLLSITGDLNELIERGAQFPAVYADSPWPYTNTATRGDYWRVSRELFLRGVRGRLPFRDRTCWVSASRTAHSRKPFVFRQLIERVSAGPYLELYGREEQHRTQWTVYGNQVERRLF